MGSLGFYEMQGLGVNRGFSSSQTLNTLKAGLPLAGPKEYATLLRQHLLSTMDKVVPPTSQREVNYSKAGTDVGHWDGSVRIVLLKNISIYFYDLLCEMLLRG